MIRTLILLLGCFYLNVHAQKLMDAQTIYEKKCAMCHKAHGPETYEEQKAMVAPPMSIAMRSVAVGTDAIEEPKTNEELRRLVIDFLKDYVISPHEDKAFCEESVFQRFNTMPSLKGFISQEQLDSVIPYVYDEFAPKKRND